MTTPDRPSAAAIAQAFGELSDQGLHFLNVGNAMGYIEFRARELDAARPAEAGERMVPLSDVLNFVSLLATDGKGLRHEYVESRSGWLVRVPDFHATAAWAAAKGRETFNGDECKRPKLSGDALAPPGSGNYVAPTPPPYIPAAPDRPSAVPKFNVGESTAAWLLHRFGPDSIEGAHALLLMQWARELDAATPAVGSGAVAWCQMEDGECVAITFNKAPKYGCTTPLYLHPPERQEGWEYSPCGFIVDGPHGFGFVADRSLVEPRIAAFCADNGDDPDDYTATEVFFRLAGSAK